MESTKFAPARRASTESFEADYNLLNDSEWLTSFINTMPEVVAILNKERQIVFGNKELLNLINITDLKSLIGKRPGEALNCVNSAEHEAGCGTCEPAFFSTVYQSVLGFSSSARLDPSGKELSTTVHLSLANPKFLAVTALCFSPSRILRTLTRPPLGSEKGAWYTGDEAVGSVPSSV